jgi:carboxyl-terminal processing protease
MLNDQISGFHGQSLSYTFLAAGQKKTVSLVLPEPDGSSGFGFVQGLTVEREARRLGPKQDIAYFRLSMFLDAVRVLPEFEKFVKASLDCQGFILDLRGNPGGIAIMANSLSGWFIQESGIKLGTMYQRNLELKFAVIPRLENFPGQLAILIDGASASTSEILAGGLQNLGRAKIFGAKSAGAALPSLIEQLPNGDFFQYAVANYISEDGKVLEGRGVTPDFPVAHTRASLLAQKDRPLEAAINWIHAIPSALPSRP